MGAETPNQVATAAGAVFLSYASQDADAARRICEALRTAGIEVWLDQSELRGGDAWDRKIRDQIRHCALFIPIISAHSQARLEGYFRREWKFAVERKRDIADELAFLLPVVIDDTPERGASVPEGFHEVQWTRLPLGAASQEFIEHVSRLLTGHQDSPKQSVQASQPSPASATHQPPSGSKSDLHLRMGLLLAAVAIVGIVCYAVFNRYALQSTAHSVAPSAPAQADKSIVGAAPAATFAPPPHSLAVLPFVNMSGDKDQEYFSDGLTEEILNSLARINELQVSARTSSFFFRGKDADLATIAHKLNVASVLEGSVRRAGNTVRITAQLNNAVTGFHLWSQTYDRDLKDVLKLQTDIANAVANALKVTLLGDLAAKIEVGGTHNPAAFDAYLRAATSYKRYETAEDLEAAIAGYTEAIRLDPNYALAYADRSLALVDFATNFAKESTVHDYLDKAQAGGRRAVAIANNLGKGHLALAYVAQQSLDFTTASKEYRSALALAPGDARVLSASGVFAVHMGETEEGLAALHRSIVLDPLKDSYHNALGQCLLAARRYNDAITAFASAKALDPGGMFSSQWLGLAYYSIGDFQGARTACESRGDEFLRPYCLALVYDKLGRHADAKTMLATLRGIWGETPSANTYYAMIYAQWGDTAQALDWLETAMHNRDPYLAEVKTSPWLDPLRKEPRFHTIERALKFPTE